MATAAFAVCQPKTTEPFDQIKAWDHLLTQVGFGPRVPNTEGHQRCGDFILAEMREYCENVREQRFDHLWSATGKPVHLRNLICEQNWKGASIRVLLLAHWDTRPDAPQESEPLDRAKPIPGANDGASGVAVLLELMRVLKQSPANVGLMYVMTDGEDLGPDPSQMFLGAINFAKDLPEERPTYGILLDMVGDKDLSIPMEAASYRAAPELMEAFYRHAADIGLAGALPRKPGRELWDDHLALIGQRIPTIDLIDFEYPAWHKLSDTPENCSPDSLGKVGRLLQSWLQSPEPWRPRTGDVEKSGKKGTQDPGQARIEGCLPLTIGRRALETELLTLRRSSPKEPLPSRYRSTQGSSSLPTDARRGRSSKSTTG